MDFTATFPSKNFSGSVETIGDALEGVENDFQLLPQSFTTLPLGRPLRICLVKNLVKKNPVGQKPD
ncbi:hypothetical protein PIB30_075944 [Stylosanthes scabra]|uniref:Uncharacterized protein n=1 Tax=Stylosanthes scabra TaxID=79078 RepID=A0ABU6ZNV2_9FABA|nr:hypothetical protein [Stylosanthes scabra]